ncbi:MAG: hypothetical protein ABWX61_06605 [Paenisporosarcina sp.]
MNKTFKLITTLLIILFLGFQYSIFLNEQKIAPSPEWSRSLPTDGQVGDYYKLQSNPTEDGYSISRLTFKRWDYADCTYSLNCDQVWSKDNFDPQRQTWSDGNTSYFIEDETLYSASKPELNVPISSSVIDFTKNKDILVYWRTDNKLVVQRGNEEAQEYVTDEPVWKSMIVDDQVFVLYKSVIKNTIDINKVVNEKVMPFAQFKTKANESIHSMDLFSLNENQFGLFLEIGLKSGGARQKKIRSATISKINPEPITFSDITLVDKVSGEKLSEVNYPSVLKENNVTYMTFSANMSSGNHVFVGEFDPERIEAFPITKGGDLYTDPIMLNEDTVIYYKKVGPHKEMMYSSKLEENREISSKGLKGDSLEAFQNLFTQFFKGIMLALLSFLWIIPATGVSYILATQLQKRGNPFVSSIMYSSYIVVMLISQLSVFSQLLKPDLMVSRIPYLSETWHLYLILLTASVVSVLPLFLSRTKIIEDNANRAIVHVTLLNLVILFILLGPYIF